MRVKPGPVDQVQRGPQAPDPPPRGLIQPASFRIESMNVGAASAAMLLP
jgi:hypothetical protein